MAVVTFSLSFVDQNNTDVAPLIWILILECKQNKPTVILSFFDSKHLMFSVQLLLFAILGTSVSSFSFLSFFSYPFCFFFPFFLKFYFIKSVCIHIT